MKVFFFTLFSITYLAASQDECLPTRCEPLGPIIRFPFRLKGSQAEHCGYPGFELSCNENNRTELHLQYPITASATNIILPLQMTVIVWQIDYEAQKMMAGGARAGSCLPEKLPEFSSPRSLFDVEAIGNGDGDVLFNCSKNTRDDETISCLSSRSYKVIPYGSSSDVASLSPYSSCFKMYNISYVPYGALTGRDDEYGDRFYLGWSRPSCGSCEAEGKFCRYRNGGTAQETECFSHEQPKHGASRKDKALIAEIAGGMVLAVFAVIASFFIFRAMKENKDEENRIKQALANCKDMRPRRYSYTDIKRSTKNFKKNLGQGSYGTLHKGVLGDGTPVVVKLLDGNQQNVEDFICEVATIGRMQHKNVLQLIGYCVDGRKRALVYEFLEGGTLEKLISSEEQNKVLGWEKLRQIALGITRGVDHVHKDSATQILNLDINPRNIMLDHNLNPRILASTSSVAEGAVEYAAPQLFSSPSNTFSPKVDVYSFGMLLLDIVGRRRNIQGREKGSCEVYFPEWFYDQLKNGEERAIRIDEQGEENEIVKKLSIVGLWCIQWFPSDRPSIKAVIQMLEGDTMPAMPPNPFTS